MNDIGTMIMFNWNIKDKSRHVPKDIYKFGWWHCRSLGNENKNKNKIKISKTTVCSYGRNVNESLPQTTHKNPCQIEEILKYEMQNSKYLWFK